MPDSILPKYREIVEQLPGYEPRLSQEAMVEAIYQALKSGSHLVVEAGTGSGKSFGYLIPALLSEHRPIVISTGTIALQEQLLEKDIPFILKAAGMEDVSVKLVKGRRNYLCLQKLQEFERTLGPQGAERLYVQRIKAAFTAGWDGDKATLDVEIPTGIWDEIQSDTEDCLGSRCQYYKENPYRLAREDIDDAAILIVNHALYLQDIAYHQAILPPHDMVIFDEAHHLKGTALRAFTARIGKYATHKLLRKIHRRLQAVPEDYHQGIYEIESALLQWLFRADKSTFKLYPDAEFLTLVDRQVSMLTDLRTWLGAVDIRQLVLATNILEADRATLQREKLLEQLDDLILQWSFFQQASDTHRVHWAEVDAERLYYEIKSTPLDVAQQFESILWPKKTTILTSATLSTNQDLSYLRRDLGMPLALESDLILDSPFNYQQQCVVYLPPQMPDPNDPNYQAAVTQEIVRILQCSAGRAFVLFTSYGAMQRACAAVIPQIPFPTKMQGDLPKHRLVEWFKQTPHSVLFATATFWEGIDVPGEHLSCVIIDRIPFTTPDEPVHSAMVDRLKQMGEDWFGSYALPQATIRLKQGFGRLIRSQQDSGLVALLDPRLRTKGYGRTILKSLPATRIIHSLDQAKPYLHPVTTEIV